MTRRLVGTSMGLITAAVVALPAFTWADDKPTQSDSVRIESRTESRTAIGSTAQQQSYEGKLIDLHQFMTGGSVSASGGHVHQMWALETPTGLILLSNPHVKPVAAAPAASSTARVIEKKTDTTTARSEVKSGTRVETEQSYESTETTVFGIERQDLSAAQNRVKISGQLYNKGGVKYLVVGSAAPAGAGASRDTTIKRDTTIERNRTDTKGKFESKTEIETEDGETESETEIEIDREEN